MRLHFHPSQCGGRWLALLLLLAAPLLRGQVPQLLHYQGRVQVGTNDFHGTGQFKFALVNADGTTTYWSNDGTAAGEPPAAVTLPVTRGLYSVLLGNVLVPNMALLPATVFTNAEVHLRVWFHDGVNGFQQFTPDQRIAAVGYAMMAASVPDGSITAAKIAPGAVSQLGTPEGSTALQVSAVGNVGIGVINPTAKLDVSGSIRAGTLSLEGVSPSVCFQSRHAPNTTGFVESGLGEQSFSAAHGGGPHRFTTPRFRFGYQTEPGQNQTPVFGFSDSGYVGSLKPDGGYRNLLDNGSGGMIIQSDADIAGDLLLSGDSVVGRNSYIRGSSTTSSNAWFKTNVLVSGHLEISGDLHVRGRQMGLPGVAYEVPADGIGVIPPLVVLQPGQYEYANQRVIEVGSAGFLVILADVPAYVSDGGEGFPPEIDAARAAMFEIFDETGNRTLATSFFSWNHEELRPKQSLRATLAVPAGRRVISTKVKGCTYHVPGIGGPYQTVFYPKMATLIVMFFPHDIGVGY